MLLSFANKSQIKKLFKFNYRSKNMFDSYWHKHIHFCKFIKLSSCTILSAHLRLALERRGVGRSVLNNPLL